MLISSLDMDVGSFAFVCCVVVFKKKLSLLLYETGISSFKIEYGRWIEEQDRQNKEIRNALQTNASDIQLHLLVENSLNQYSNLFRIKAEAAKVDALYLISGAWKKPLERLFLWFGGSCPSQLLNVNPLTVICLKFVVNIIF